MGLKGIFSFRVKLLLALMLVVVTVTSATLYLAERNVQARYQESLDVQFQAQMRLFTALQETRLSAITEKCRALSHSVRLRAALEERDVEDLYRNALTELQGIFGGVAQDKNDADTSRASFCRFLDSDGTILPPNQFSAGVIDRESLDQILAPMNKALRNIEEQTVGYIALARGNELSALREVVVTKVLDWDGKNLGALVLGFAVSDITGLDRGPSNAISSGIWLREQLYSKGLNATDRQLLAQRISQAMVGQTSGHFPVTLASGPQLVFFKAIDPDTQLAPAYEICLYPLASAMREQHELRWKIMALGLGVLVAGFAASLFISKGLSEPVNKIVAGSVENLTMRRRAERDLRAANQELEKALAELKATQQQVIQQERLSAIGQMASGIAHDFNNTLTPILGFSDLLLEKPGVLENTEQARKFLGFLRTSAQDAASVVSRLRQFYRRRDEDEKFPIIDLNSIVTQAISLTEPKWRRQAQANGVTIQIESKLQQIPAVAGDESALREVLTNLIFNAVDAMPNGGSITLETVAENNQAVIRVRDTGAGMTEEVRRRCLEPFFSTKGEQGTGLGLSMVYGIVERHRGKLEIESTPDKGTTFIIRLPSAAAEETKTVASFHQKNDQPLNVLVVDDEARVREVISAFLRAEGHVVTTASSGQEGIEQFRTVPFDMVVTDRAMPEMSGDQMASLVKKMRPEIPIVLLTGFGALIEVTGSQPKDVDVVLSKPVTLAALRKTIDSLRHAA
jgi:signal transduction histidine kinase